MQIFIEISIIAVLTVASWLYLKKIGIDYSILLIAIFSGSPFIGTLLYSGNIISCFSGFIQYLSIFMLTKLGTKYNSRMFFALLYRVLMVLVVVNAITIVLFPEGLYQIVRETGWNSRQAWLLGLRNGEPYWIIFFCMMVFFRKDAYLGWKGLLEKYICISISIFSLLKLHGGGAMVSVAMILVYLFFEGFFESVYLDYIYLIFNGLFFILFVVVQVQQLNDGIVGWFANLIGRNATFTGRTFVWKRVIEWIKINPIFGWGIEFENIIMRKISVNGDTAFIKCHNTILDILYSGGFLMFILFIVILFCMIKNGRTHSVRKWAPLSYFYLFAALFLGQTETAIYNKAFIFMSAICMTYSFDYEQDRRYMLR